MQTEGIKGGRTYNPIVYSEKGVAMLTSCLHTRRAIEASIQIIEAFVEMSHYLRDNRQLLPYEELKSLEVRHFELYERVRGIEDNLASNMISRSELSELMRLFSLWCEQQGCGEEDYYYYGDLGEGGLCRDDREVVGE